MGDRGCLSVHDRRQLLKWNLNSDRKELHLLYSFNRDGARASTFHDKCDQKGPTYTVLYSPCGSVYGGYTSESWEKGNVYKTDATAFLFSLSFKNRRKDLKFPVINTQKAIYCYDYYGPTFGNGYHWIPFWKGYDMFTFKGELTKNNDTYTLNGYFKFGNTYDMLNKRTDDVTNGSTTVSNLEVYGIRDIAGSLPWRLMPPLTKELLEELRTEVEQFSPCNRQVEKAKILLFGQRCAGKSSFVNNTHSAFKQRRAQRAITGSADVKATIKLQEFSFVTGRTGHVLRFQLCDMPGLEETDSPNADDIYLMLDGYVKDGYVFEPGERIPQPREDNDTEPPQLNDQIHTVCFVVDGATVSELSDATLAKTKEILEVIRRKGVPLMILLTKMDKIIPGLGSDMSLIFKSAVVEQLVHQVAEMFDVQHNQILPTKNYESETDVLNEVDALTLFNVKQMLITTKDFMVNGTLPIDFVMTMYKRKERQHLSESDLSDA